MKKKIKFSSIINDVMLYKLLLYDEQRPKCRKPKITRELQNVE